MDYSVDATLKFAFVLFFFFFRFDTKIGIEHQTLLFFSSLKVVRSLSLSLSLSRVLSRVLAVLVLFSKSRLDLFLRPAVRLSLIVVVVA